MDSCIRRIGIPLFPTKGYHFPPNSFVEYEGQIPVAERDTIVHKLQHEVDHLVSEDTPLTVSNVPPSELERLCEPGIFAHGNPYAALPTVRVVTVAGNGCPCGGTHVPHLGALKKVVIEKVKAKGKNVRVSYHVECEGAPIPAPEN